jgi:PhnB protein
MSIQLCAYMSYDGDCTEAMNFYAQVLGAKLEALITYGQMPGEMPVPPEHAERVMHAYLVHKDFALMAGDAPPGVPYAGIQGCMLAITYPTAAEATRVFNALAEGGKVGMPLGETFWADTFGMVTDRFGTPWGVNGGPREMARP